MRRYWWRRWSLATRRDIDEVLALVQDTRGTPDPRIDEIIGLLHEVRAMAIDTARLLVAVEWSVTESASLRALLAAREEANRQLRIDLAAAIAANDPAMLAQVQKDLDDATARLSLDDADVAAAVAANTPAPAGITPQP